MGELMVGPYQRYCGDGAAPASRWGSRHSIRSHRYSGGTDNLMAIDERASIVDGAGIDTNGLRAEPGWVPSGALAIDTLIAPLREVVLHDLATRHGVPDRFLRGVLFGAPDLRAAAGLDSRQVQTLRAEYQHDSNAAAAHWGIDLPPRRSSGHGAEPTAFVCDACDTAVHDGRCRCT